MESSATTSPDQPPRSPADLVRDPRVVRYARPALIAGAVAAVVCTVLLVIIFLLDSFNATVYSVGGENISDATDEARQIRELYSGARVGGVVFLIVSLLVAAASAVVLFLQRKNAAADADDDEDLGFDDLAGR